MRDFLKSKSLFLLLWDSLCQETLKMILKRHHVSVFQGKVSIIRNDLTPLKIAFIHFCFVTKVFSRIAHLQNRYITPNMQILIACKNPNSLTHTCSRLIHTHTFLSLLFGPGESCSSHWHRAAAWGRRSWPGRSDRWRVARPESVCVCVDVFTRADYGSTHWR